MEQDHYPHTKLEQMDRDPQAWLRSKMFEQACFRAGVSQPWQVFAVAQQIIKEQDDADGSDRDKSKDA